MSELTILKLVESKDNYDRYKHLISEHVLTSEAASIFRDLEQYYETNTETAWEDFATWFKLKHSSKRKESLELYDKIFETLSASDLDLEESDLVHTLILRDYASRIASHALRVVDGDEDCLDDIEDLYNRYVKEADKVSELDAKIVTDDLDTILSDFVAGGGLEWRLEELNASLGPIRKGDLVVVAALPETGKTTMLASEASYMMQYLPEDEHVLWFNNEEEGRRVKFRCIQAVLGCTKEEIEANPVDSWKKYLSLTGDRILIYDEARLHYKEVEQVFKKYNPGLIIFDQLRKVKGFKGKSEVDILVEVFGWARELAKVYCPVIAVHQADGSAIGKEYVEIENLYYSRIGIQGEADAILTIADPKGNDPYVRNLNICKNKLAGSSSTEERYRHSKWSVYIEPEIARYRSP